MKIVRLVSELDFGGVEKVIELSALEINRRKDIELLVLVLSKGGRVSQHLIDQGVNVVILNNKCKIPNFNLIFRLIWFFKKNKIHVVHSSGAEANFHGLLAGYLANINIRVGEEIGYPNHHFFWQLIFKIIYRLSHRVIVISKAVQQFIVNKREVPLRKTQVIYNPVEIIDDQLICSREDDRFHFITVSRLVPIKNLEGLLRAFSLLDFEDKALNIVGDGPERIRLEELAVNLGIQHQIKFLGYQKDVAKLLCCADCFVLPSFSEGSSVALAEAMMAQLPSIVTQIGGASEIIGNSKSGLLIDPYDVNEIKEAMGYIIGLDEKDRKKMGQGARKYAMEKFSPSHYVNCLLASYKNIH